MRKISRRSFTKKSAIATAAIAFDPLALQWKRETDKPGIPLGGPLFSSFNNPDDWIKRLRESGYTAAYCPLDPGSGGDEIRAYRQAASRADIIIAEVGAWSNPISPDQNQREAAIDKCIKSLHLADEIGASCCVNISGSRNPKHWAGPHHDNLTDEVFEMVVETTRKIIDHVKPVRTWFTLEAMPWSFPHSPDAYVRLIKAIDRDRFAVHMDPVNMVVSPEIYFNNGALIRDCFKKLGPYIKSCHAKDITLREDIYTPHLTEVRPGLGLLNYKVFLQELAKFPNVPLMMEHLDTEAEYRLASEYIRSEARKSGIKI